MMNNTNVLPITWPLFMPRFHIALPTLLALLLSVSVRAEFGSNKDQAGSPIWLPKGQIIDLSESPAPSSIQSEVVNKWLNTEVKQQLGLADNEALEISSQRPVKGHSLFKVQQTFKGVPVMGFQSAVSLRSGQADTLLGRHHSIVSADAELPEVELKTAMHKAGFFMPEKENAQSRLVYWPNGGEHVQLAYEVTGASVIVASAVPEKVYLSAVTGELLDRSPLVYSGLKREVSDLAAACSDFGIRAVMHPVQSQGVQAAAKLAYSRREGQASSGDPVADKTYELLGQTYNFIQDVLEMDSLDNRGMTLTAFTNVRFAQGSYSPQCVGDAFNAAWSSQWKALYLTREANDYVEVFAHELGHGLISAGSDLVYKNEPGALNESIADAIGVGFRGWYELGNSSQNFRNVPEAMWDLRSPDQVLRNLKLPKSADEDLPEHYREFLYMQQDNGGVHYNSSIPNVAFYLLSEGGQHPRFGTGPQINGIGLIKATQIYATAASAVLTSHSTFEDARYGFAHTAELMFGKSSHEWVAVHQAMDAVGIPGQWQMPPDYEPPEEEPVPEPEEKSAVEEEEKPKDDNAQSDADEEDQESGDDTEEQASEGEPTDTKKLIAVGLLILAAGALAVLTLLLVRTKSERPELRSYQADGKPEAPPDVPPSPGNTGDNQIPSTNARPQVVPAPPTAASGQWSLASSDGTKHLPLNETWLTSAEGLVIGRSLDLVHVEFSETSVSRRHCRLRLRGGTLTVEDLASSQGTYCNGQKLKAFTPHGLASGDMLELSVVRCYLRRT